MERASDTGFYYFLQGGGECGELIRKTDWEQTPLGSPDKWPAVMKSQVKAMLDSPFATALFFGPEMIRLYNDPFSLTLGPERHPSVMGKPAQESSQSWDMVGQLFADAFDGKPTYLTDVKLILNKTGNPEECYMDMSYVPVYLEDGTITGIQVIIVETTEKIRALAELQKSEAKFRSLIEEAPVATAVFTGREMKIDIVNEPMIKIWGKGPSITGKPIREALPELEGQPFFQLLDDVFTTGITYEAVDARADLVVNGVPGTYYFDFSYKALRNADGEIYGIMEMAVDVTERFLATHALEKNQEQLLTYFEQAPVAIAVIGRENLTFRMANPFYGELVGRTHEELQDKSLLEALPELRDQGFDKLLQGVLDTGNPFIANEVEVEILRNGQLEFIYVDLIYQPQRDLKNAITGILVVATDVTSQVRARKAIEESEAFTRTVFNDSPIAKIVYTGEDMVIRDANEKMLDIFGRESTDNFVGLPLMEAVPELRATPLYDRYLNVLKNGGIHIETAERLELIRYGESYFGYYDYIYKPLRTTDGEIYGVICTAIEVTEQVIARQKLEETESRLSGAIELAGLATWTLNVQEGTFHYSQRFMDWLGFSEDTKGLDDAYNPLPEEYRQSVPDAIDAALAEGASGVYDNIHPIVNRVTGQQRIIHAQGQVFLDASGNPAYLRGTAQDITIQQELQMELSHEVKERTEELAATVEELQATNEELEEVNLNLFRSNEELSQYAYIASHDLQEPLRKIRVFSGILSQQKNLAPENKPVIAKIDASALRMSQLIKDLLDFSGSSTSDKTLTPVDLNQIVKEIVTDFELIITEKNAAITFESLPVINAVALQMNQLFYNMIGNALKFVEAGKDPVIRIVSVGVPAEKLSSFIHKPKRDAVYYDISVTDNGIGFEDKFSDQIFEVFKRLHGKDSYPGSGIGLALCKRIVTNHGGHLYSESKIGVGTTFHIILPGS